MTFGVSKIGSSEKFLLLSLERSGLPLAASLGLHPDETLPDEWNGWRWNERRRSWSFAPTSWSQQSPPLPRPQLHDGRMMPHLIAMLVS